MPSPFTPLTGLQDLRDADALLGRHEEGVGCVQPDHVGDLLAHPLHVSTCITARR